MYYALFNGFLEHMNDDCLPPRFKIDQVDCEFLLGQLLFIRGDATNMSLQFVCDLLQISEAPGGGFSFSIA
jgi:hypothetical protein